MAKQKVVTTINTQHITERQQRVLDGVAAWAGYYRCNPHRFAKDFLHLDLHLFQKILLVIMNISNSFVFIACRGIGKTFLSAIFCASSMYSLSRHKNMYCIWYSRSELERAGKNYDRTQTKLS